MKNDLVTVEILVNDKSITEYNHSGNIYVEGRKGKPFTIRITNKNLFKSILAVVSVDGLSVINSEIASENSPGYVVNPMSTTDIKGWRVDDDNVSEFVFAKKANGYAAAIEQDGHEGSIGVMIFEDDSINVLMDKWRNDNQILGMPQNPYPYGNGNSIWYLDPSSGQLGCTNVNYNAGTRSDGEPTLSLDRNTKSVSPSKGVLRSARRIDITPDEPLAVGHGEQVESKVESVEFTRPDTPSYIFAMFYDTRKGLEKRGIKISQDVEINEPSPFPASTMYCKAPVGGWHK